MLYNETFIKLAPSIKNAVQELFNAASNNQTDENDLLLILEHGFYDDAQIEFYKKNKLSPYVIGPNIEGHEEQTQDDFFVACRSNIILNKVDFVGLSNKSERNIQLEKNTIHIEMLGYLKFWEADMIIKKLYQLTRLANGEEYDWHFKRSKFKNGRQEILRLYVRDKLKTIVPSFYSLLDNIYNNQIRNAIAHSQYTFIGENIKLNNKEESKLYKYHNITFKEWEIYIHSVLLLHNELTNQFNIQREKYIENVKDKQYGLGLRITKKEGHRETSFLNYDKTLNRWNWYNHK